MEEDISILLINQRNFLQVLVLYLRPKQKFYFQKSKKAHFNKWLKNNPNIKYLGQ